MLERIGKITGGGDGFTALQQMIGITHYLHPEEGIAVHSFLGGQNGDRGGSQIETVQQDCRRDAQQMTHHHTGDAQMTEDDDGILTMSGAVAVFCYFGVWI